MRWRREPPTPIHTKQVQVTTNFFFLIRGLSYILFFYLILKVFLKTHIHAQTLSLVIKIRKRQQWKSIKKITFEAM